MNNFSHYFSFEKYQQMASYHHGQSQENITREIYTSLEKEMAEALDSFLKDYRQEYTLKPFINEDTHQTNFNYFWNDYISNSSSLKEYQVEREIQRISDKLFFWHQVNHSKELIAILNNIKQENTTKENKEELLNLYYKQSYDKFVDLVTIGDISRKYDLSEDYCFDCGKRFHIEFKNWTPVFIDRAFIPEPSSPIGQKTVYSVAKDCYKEYTNTIPITFKTGNLLISDWFRIPEFTAFVDDKFKFDINCSKGRLELATYLATNFNVMSAPSYGSPHILQKNDRIIIAEYSQNDDYDEDEDEEDNENEEHNTKEAKEDNNEELEAYLSHYEYKERANSGLRNVTIIEKEQLVDLIVQSGKTLKEAQSIVDKYIEDNDFEIQSLTVSPGVYNFKFAGNCDYFKPHTQQEEDFPKEFNPFCVVENTNLTLNKKMKI